jgi:hypothetical protein
LRIIVSFTVGTSLKKSRYVSIYRVYENCNCFRYT